MNDVDFTDRQPDPGQGFSTTHWSVVMTARDGDGPAARAALEKLCQAYRSPILTFIRREGYREADAEDLTQEFFAHLQKVEFLTHLVHCKGRFRSFLLKFLQHFLSDQRDKARAQKRGGDREIVPLDAVPEVADGLTPSQAFEIRWLETLLAMALERLRQEYVAAGKEPLFQALQDLHLGERDGNEAGHAEIGARLGLSESAMKSALHRFRRRHREVVRETIANTVQQPSEIDDEIRHLMALRR